MAKKYTLDSVIEKFKEKHGGKYDYSKVEYVNNHTKVRIICPIHGEFWQTPLNHIQSHGCPKCAKSGVKLTTDEFITKAQNVHKNKYDYSNVNYC